MKAVAIASKSTLKYSLHIMTRTKFHVVNWFLFVVLFR